MKVNIGSKECQDKLFSLYISHLQCVLLTITLLITAIVLLAKKVSLIDKVNL